MKFTALTLLFTDRLRVTETRRHPIKERPDVQPCSKPLCDGVPANRPLILNPLGPSVNDVLNMGRYLCVRSPGPSENGHQPNQQTADREEYRNHARMSGERFGHSIDRAINSE